jgi:molybdopterin converting factor small subunit
MSLRFLIPGALRPFASGASVVNMEWQGGTLGAALSSLWAAYPGLRLRLVNEQGIVRPHVNLFVAGENSRDTGGLATPVPDGAEIAIIPAVSGGARALAPLPS